MKKLICCLFFLLTTCFSFAGKEELLSVRDEIEDLAHLKELPSADYFTFFSKVFEERYGELYKLVWDNFKAPTPQQLPSIGDYLHFIETLKGCLDQIEQLTDESAHGYKVQYDKLLAVTIAYAYRIACDILEITPLCPRELNLDALTKNLIYRLTKEGASIENLHLKIADKVIMLNKSYLENKTLELLLGNLSIFICLEIARLWIEIYDNPFLALTTAGIPLPQVILNSLDVIQKSKFPFEAPVAEELAKGVYQYGEISQKTLIREKEVILEKQRLCSSSLSRGKEILCKLKQLRDPSKKIVSTIQCTELQLLYCEAYMNFLSLQLPQDITSPRNDVFSSLTKLIDIPKKLAKFGKADTPLLENFAALPSYVHLEEKPTLFTYLASESFRLGLYRHAVCASLEAFTLEQSAKNAKCIGENIAFLIRLICSTPSEGEMIKTLAAFAREDTRFSVAYKGTKKKPVIKFSKEWMQQSLVQYFVWLGREDLAFQFQMELAPKEAQHRAVGSPITLKAIKIVPAQTEQKIDAPAPVPQATDFSVPYLSRKDVLAQAKEETIRKERKSKLKAERPKKEPEVLAVASEPELAAVPVQERFLTLKKREFETFQAIMQLTGQTIKKREVQRLIAALGGEYFPGRGSHVKAHLLPFELACDRIQFNHEFVHIANLPPSGESAETPLKADSVSQEGLITLTSTEDLKPYQVSQIRGVLGNAGYSFKNVHSE